MEYRSRGVRALVMLQMREMRELFKVWRKAKRVSVRLPKTRDPNYESLDHVMRHSLRACRGYLTWLCEQLRRANPRVPDPPEPGDVATQGKAYLDVLDAAWQKHMAWMTDRGLYSKRVLTSRWGHPMTVEAMLEHALVHPIRHRFQLEELIAAKARKARSGQKRGSTLR